MPEVFTGGKLVQLHYSPEDSTFIFNCTYHDRDIPRQAQFMWNRDIRKWITRDPLAAKKLIEYADPSAKTEIEKAIDSLELSTAADADIDVPAPEGLSYLPFQLAGIAFALQRPDVLIADEMGCISGDTIVNINRADGARKYQLKDAYFRFHNKWDKNIDSYTRSLSADKREFRLNKIKNILFKGNRAVYEVTTETHNVKATSDHVFFSENGEKELNQLVIGEKIYTNGIQACPVCGQDKNLVSYRNAKFKGYCKECVYKHKRNNNVFVGERIDKDGYRVVTSDLTYHPHRRTDGIYKHRLVYEAFLNGVSYEKWREIVRFRKFKKDAIFLTPQVAIHHINGIKTDNRLSNLEILPHNKHQKKHGSYTNFKEFFLPELEKITDIKFVGIEPVYDIQMEGPNHNFIANGVVVHNCGKTIQAIGCINARPELKNILVVCPALLKLNWRNELQRWLVRNYRINVVSGTAHKSDTYFAEGFTLAESEIAGDIYIINYDILDDGFSNDRAFDLLIADESHYCKNKKARRTKELAKAAANIRSRLFLTGTPVTNKPIDLLPVLEMMRHPLADNWYYYVKRYCDACKDRFGWRFGSSHEEELQARLRSTVMIRREKKDVLAELPEKFRQVVTLPHDSLEKAIGAEQQYLGQMKQQMKEFREQAKGKDKNSEEYKRAIEEMRAVRLMHISEIARLRHLTALAKVPLVIDYIRMTLDDDGEKKLVIFCHHKDVLAQLHEAFGNSAVRVSGDDKTEDRQLSVERFQNDPGVRLFLGTIMASGVGITLTAASHCIFVELDWLPSNMQQAEDRLHRIGQHDNVLVQYIVVDRSIDSFVAKKFVSKADAIERATDHEHMDRYMDEFFG